MGFGNIQQSKAFKLPKGAATGMLYANRKRRGLDVIHFKWEVFLQHFSIANRGHNETLHWVYDCQAKQKFTSAN